MASKALKLLQEHVASQQAFHKAMTETATDAGARSAHTSAFESCTKTMAACEKADTDELEKADKDVAETLGEKLQVMISEALAKALGERVMPRGISRLAPAASTARAIPRVGAPDPVAKVDVPVELQQMWGGNLEDQEEV